MLGDAFYKCETGSCLVGYNNFKPPMVKKTKLLTKREEQK